METIMTPVAKPASKTKAKKPDATEKARKAASKEIGERLAKAEAADASPTAAATPTPPATEGGKEPKKEKKAPGSAKLAKPAPGEGAAKQLGGLDAAAIVLKAANGPMNCKEMWAAIDAKKMWFTEGKTPEATIYSAIIREIAAKGKDSRFKKAARGKFEYIGKDA
jgi:hypothetical protein